MFLFNSQLQKIVRDADKKGEGPAVCSLTGEERHVWFEVYEILIFCYSF